MKKKQSGKFTLSIWYSSDGVRPDDVPADAKPAGGTLDSSHFWYLFNTEELTFESMHGDMRVDFELCESTRKHFDLTWFTALEDGLGPKENGIRLNMLFNEANDSQVAVVIDEYAITEQQKVLDDTTMYFEVWVRHRDTNKEFSCDPSVKIRRPPKSPAAE